VRKLVELFILVQQLVLLCIFSLHVALCYRLQSDSTLSESSVNDIRRKVHEAVTLNKAVYNLYLPVSVYGVS